MTEMVERVARALFTDDYLGMREDDRERYWTEQPSVREGFLRQARAAIAAMREPTEAMVKAGAEKDEWVQREGQDPQPEVYRAMIDEALK